MFQLCLCPCFISQFSQSPRGEKGCCVLGAPPGRWQPDPGGLGMLCLESGITGGEGLQTEAINVAFVGRVWIRVSGELGARPSTESWKMGGHWTLGDPENTGNQFERSNVLDRLPKITKSGDILSLWDLSLHSPLGTWLLISVQMWLEWDLRLAFIVAYHPVARLCRKKTWRPTCP